MSGKGQGDDHTGWLRALQTRQDASDEKVDTLTRSFNHFADEVRQALGRLGSTDWRSLAAWAGIVLAVGGVFGTFIRSDVTRLEGVLARQGVNAIEQARANGRAEGYLERFSIDTGSALSEVRSRLRALEQGATPSGSD